MSFLSFCLLFIFTVMQIAESHVTNGFVLCRQVLWLEWICKVFSWTVLVYFVYLLQGGDVLFFVCLCVLSVCLYVSVSLFVCWQNLSDKLWMDSDDIFWRDRAWPKEELIRFWWLSGYLNPGSFSTIFRHFKIGIKVTLWQCNIEVYLRNWSMNILNHTRDIASME